MGKLLLLALLVIIAQPVYAHGLKEKPFSVEEGGYSIELITEPKYPVIWKKTTLVVVIQKDGLSMDGLRAAFTLHGPGHGSEVLINANPRGRGAYAGTTTFREPGVYEVHINFDETQGTFDLKVDSLGLKGVLRGLIVALIIGALITKSMKSCGGDVN